MLLVHAPAKERGLNHEFGYSTEMNFTSAATEARGPGTDGAEWPLQVMQRRDGSRSADRNLQIGHYSFRSQ